MDYASWIRDLALILRGGADYYDWCRRNIRTRSFQDCLARDWHGREQRRYPMHPAVLKALELSPEHRPYDWHLLTLEWPHVSETDSTRLAYTRDERAGHADRQTVTTVGKYLTRHFPTLPDHVVRNLVALYSAGDSCKLVHTMAEMLHHLFNGPSSCMTRDMEVRCADGVRRHPYQVYDPKYGWHMAVRMFNGETVGRALCMSDGNTKYFVRSYRRAENYSPADEQLEAWLVSQGYEKQSRWDDDDKLAYYEVDRGDILAPYIDGGTQAVSLYGDHLRIDRNGEYDCSQTGGTASGGGSETCEDCGDRFADGDGYWVGVNGELAHICSSCCDNEYTYVYGRRQDMYFVHSRYAIEIGGHYYDEDYLSDNDIVALENGDYADMDNCVMVGDDWYLFEDERVCRPEDSDDYWLTEDCWQCEESGCWYTDSTESVEVDGKTYHPDNAPEQETADEE